jgi:putative peptidoglycan lipid II flippase
MWIGVGLALTTSLAGTAQAIVAIVVLRRKIGRVDGTRIARRFGVFALAAIPTAGVGVALLLLLGGISPGGFAVSGVVGAVVSLITIGSAMALVYVGGLALIRNPELTALTSPLLARVRNRK